MDELEYKTILDLLDTKWMESMYACELHIILSPK